MSFEWYIAFERWSEGEVPLLNYVLILFSVSTIGFILAGKVIPGICINEGLFTMALYFGFLQSAIACGVSFISVLVIIGSIAFALGGCSVNASLVVVVDWLLIACLGGWTAELFYLLRRQNSEKFEKLRFGGVLAASVSIVAVQIYLVRPLVHKFFSDML